MLQTQRENPWECGKGGAPTTTFGKPRRMVSGLKSLKTAAHGHKDRHDRKREEEEKTLKMDEHG